MTVSGLRSDGDRPAGVAVGNELTPSDLDEAAAALRESAQRGTSVAFLGGGTEFGYGYPAKRVDLLLRTTSLNRIVEYTPADMTITVEAGLTLAALQERLAEEGQRLALDPPRPALATLGGLLATNGFGPRRARCGGLRDLIVGVSLIRADGLRVRGGGKVVKNVAGFDLPKLMVGSLGTLGMIATATFRLHPLPQSALVVRVPACEASDLRALRNAMVGRQLEPTALLAVRANWRYEFYVLFEGFAVGVDEQAQRFLQLALEYGRPGELLDGGGFSALDDEARTYGSVRVRLAAPPSALEALDREALAPLERAVGDAKAALYPSLGIAFLGGFPGDPAVAAEAVLGARRILEALGGNLVVTEAGEPAFAGRVDPFGTLPSSFALMERLKARFDPERRLNGGRFLGGL
jgi:glycolate oxidase FAD binding subunit